MAIDEGLEERSAASRSRIRQHKTVPWLIRDDGMLMPNVPLIAKKSNYRPYHGDPAAPLAERMRFLSGLGRKRQVVNTAVEEEEAFDIAKAGRDELCAFVLEQTGEVLDPSEHLNKLRSQAARLLGISGADVFQKATGKVPAEAT